MRAFRAHYIFPGDSSPLRNGVVAVDLDRIIAVGDESSAAAKEFGHVAGDLGNVAILPGLINAHTHLEFSDLREPVGTPGMAFADWIRMVVRNRRQRQASENSRSLDSISHGIKESSACGVTALGEIASTPWHRDAKSPLEITEFCEVIALRSGMDDTRYMSAVNAVKSADQWNPCFRPGISPHTPYTVRPDLIASLVHLSAEHHIPLAHHLAETREELMLLHGGKGPLVDMLTEFGQWDPQTISAGSRPLDYLRMLKEAHRSLVIHGNYLADDEIEFLAQHRDRMSVVYCPRTHAFFKHDRYPLAKMLSAGVNVALGTDSRASNPDLSILAELQFTSHRHPAIAPAILLQMITTSAAQALGRDQEIGTIAKGKLADLTVVRLPKFEPGDPYELLLDPTCQVMATFFRGAPSVSIPFTAGN